MEEHESFRYSSILTVGTVGSGLIISGAVLLPVCPPIGIMFIIAGGLIMLNVPLLI